MSPSAPAGLSAPTLAVVDGISTTTSLDVARHFGRPHKDVLRRIRALLEELDPEHQRNFSPMFIQVDIGQGATRQDPAYRITRDGFTLLAMGFTGKRALQWKLAYLDAFNRMEAQLAEQAHALPGIDPRALMLAGQSSAVPLTRAQQAQVNRQAWLLAHEAYELARAHIERRVAYRVSRGDLANPAAPSVAKVVRGVTLGNALAHAYHTEVRHVLDTAQIMQRMANDTAERVHQLKRMLDHKPGDPTEGAHHD